ncbi:hypothetical protein JB92DRAFT_2971117 [Gautieria morchelliformis]|nr:hypothetical protein JB92DRAFT_2971117 [Gautieria morchelliformis]
MMDVDIPVARVEYSTVYYTPRERLGSPGVRLPVFKIPTRRPRSTYPQTSCQSKVPTPAACPSPPSRSIFNLRVVSDTAALDAIVMRCVSCRCSLYYHPVAMCNARCTPRGLGLV